jgi:hypothetical protein
MNARAIFPASGKRYRLFRRPTEPIKPSAPRPYRRDCQGRLIAALLDHAGTEGEVFADSLTPWASATFIGARHAVTLVLRGEDAMARADALRMMLPEAEFHLPGHIVADLVVDSISSDEPGAAKLLLSVLTIEAW